MTPPTIDYRAVLVELARRAWPLDDGLVALGRPLVFATLITRHRFEVSGACFVACDDLRATQEAARWLRRVGTAYFLVTSPMAEIVAPVIAPCGRLDVVPALAGLPLLDLAEDLAPSQPNGTLEVLVGPLDDQQHALGQTRRHPDRTTVVLDLDRIAASPSRRFSVEGIWAHELGHVLEPSGLHPTDSESFADEAGDLLLKLRPTTAREAGALVARLAPAPTAIGDVFVDLAEFHTLDLGAGDIRADVLAAASPFPFRVKGRPAPASHLAGVNRLVEPEGAPRRGDTSHASTGAS